MSRGPTRRRFARAVGVAFAASLAVGACGSSGSPGSAALPATLDAAKVEQAIERSSLAQRGARARASCPTGVRQKKGLAFSCTAVVDGKSTEFAVTQLDAFGHVHYEGR